MVREPLPGVVVAEIEQAALVAAENPFRMVLRQPRAGGHPLRLEPHENLDVLAVGIIGDGPQPAREPGGVHLPRADTGPAAAVMHVPPGVHPPVVELDVLLAVAVDEQDLLGFIGVDHLVVLARAGSEQLRLGQPAVGLGHRVRHHPAPPDVLGDDPVAFPELQHDQRAADLLARQQLEVGQFLAGRQVQALRGVADEFGRPLPGPADGDDDPFAGPFEVEVRPVGVGGPAAGPAQMLADARAERRLKRAVVVAGRGRAHVVVEQELAAVAAIDADVERLDLLEDGRVGRAGVLEVQRPFRGGEIVVFDEDAADLQAGCGVGLRQRMPGAMGVELLGVAGCRPGLEQIGRWLAVVDE